MRSTIKIQEWRMPTITDEDQRMIDRGARAFWKRRGITIAENFGDIIRGAAKAGRAAKARRESV